LSARGRVGRSRVHKRVGGSRKRGTRKGPGRFAAVSTRRSKGIDYERPKKKLGKVKGPSRRAGKGARKDPKSTPGWLALPFTRKGKMPRPRRWNRPKENSRGGTKYKSWANPGGGGFWPSLAVIKRKINKGKRSGQGTRVKLQPGIKQGCEKEKNLQAGTKAGG